MSQALWFSTFIESGRINEVRLHRILFVWDFKMWPLALIPGDHINGVLCFFFFFKKMYVPWTKELTSIYKNLIPSMQTSKESSLHRMNQVILWISVSFVVRGIHGRFSGTKKTGCNKRWSLKTQYWPLDIVHVILFWFSRKRSNHRFSDRARRRKFLSSSLLLSCKLFWENLWHGKVNLTFWIAVVNAYGIIIGDNEDHVNEGGITVNSPTNKLAHNKLICLPWISSF